MIGETPAQDLKRPGGKSEQKPAPKSEPNSEAAPKRRREKGGTPKPEPKAEPKKSCRCSSGPKS